jgi:AraC-like DNA-binding protein
MEAESRLELHSHAWAQIAFSMTGVIRMSTAHSTFLVPPSRAVWIPPRVEHLVDVVEPAEIRTLYIHQDERTVGPGLSAQAGSRTWRECRVIEVSSLLRELVDQLPVDPAAAPTEREATLSWLVLDELRRAPALRLGIALPGEPRLRALCEAVLENPGRWQTLTQCARHAGASARTVARLFRSELNTSFVQWRQQVVLAHAMMLAAQHTPMSEIASELGYASPSAFSAMVRRSVGAPPSRFLAGALREL